MALLLIVFIDMMLFHVTVYFLEFTTETNFLQEMEMIWDRQLWKHVAKVKKKKLKVDTTQWKILYLVWDADIWKYGSVKIEFEVVRTVIPCSLIDAFNP